MVIPMHPDLHLMKKQNRFLMSSDKQNKSPPTVDEQTHVQTLKNLLESSQRVLMRIDTVWPLDFFPDTLIIDPLKLTYTHRSFFMVAYTESILISDLIETDVEISPLFATLRISFISYPTRQILIKPLWKQQASHAREIIAGLRIAHKQHVPMENLPTEHVSMLGTLANAENFLF